MASFVWGGGDVHLPERWVVPEEAWNGMRLLERPEAVPVAAAAPGITRRLPSADAAVLDTAGLPPRKPVRSTGPGRARHARRAGRS